MPRQLNYVFLVDIASEIVCEEYEPWIGSGSINLSKNHYRKPDWEVYKAPNDERFYGSTETQIEKWCDASNVKIKAITANMVESGFLDLTISLQIDDAEMRDLPVIYSGKYYIE